MKKFVTAVVSVLITGGTALAGELQERNISLATANEIVSQAAKACTAKGYNVSVAVVDRAGVLRAMVRTDRAGPHTVEAARAKAFTAASSRVATGTMAENIQKNPAAAQMAAIPGFLVLAGGVPIKIGDETIGAVGIGGAPGGNIDEACALEALDALKDKLK
ncbi:heme-binding protein [Brucella pituitosa]|uniref:GlcG/HbpS family heme-binding protein n=1 Tax=Brucella pituitosa TaxID=571256 RepID=UPI002006AA76|nr:heme-binding protein [Brucella pituitosa]MCK4206842.1 heme-binding protein [Brucella pituitosa]